VENVFDATATTHLPAETQIAHATCQLPASKTAGTRCGEEAKNPVLKTVDGKSQKVVENYEKPQTAG
jgi:hypothetical protein